MQIFYLSEDLRRGISSEADIPRGRYHAQTGIDSVPAQMRHSIHACSCLNVLETEHQEQIEVVYPK